MFIFARHCLVPPDFATPAPALLLEGSWPEDTQSDVRWSLDDAIDARHEWIDLTASQLADEIAGEGDGVSLAWLNVLSLRYYLVKLLRVVAFFESGESSHMANGWQVRAETPRDDDYVDLLEQLAQRHGTTLWIDWIASKNAPTPTAASNGWLRRVAAAGNEWLNRLVDRSAPQESAEAGTSRVLLCGNPRILDPVCCELYRRGCRLAWLYDRFAFGAFVRWRACGIRQLVCQSDRGERNDFADGSYPLQVQQSIELHDTDLSGPIRRFLSGVCAHRGTRQTRLLEQIDRHLREFRPTHVVLDEDATPLPRTIVAIARQLGVPSIVVQHGAPRVRFGYAPLAADRICVWGKSSSQLLQRWGVTAEQIAISGAAASQIMCNRPPCSPTRERGEARQRLSLADASGYLDRRQSPRILLFATVAPNDARPDAVTFHLTTRTHREMLRMAFAAVSEIVGAELIVKQHPRCVSPAVFSRIAAEFPDLRCRIVQKTSVARLLQNVDCVLNCCSSAGIEAAVTGVPVIDLLPAGSQNELPARDWGLFAAAGSLPELRAMLHDALAATDFAPQPLGSHSAVFARHGRDAAAAIVEAVLSTQPAGRQSLEIPFAAAPSIA